MSLVVYVEKLRAFQTKRLRECVVRVARARGRPAWWVLPQVVWLLTRGFNYYEIEFFQLIGKPARQTRSYHRNVENAQLVYRLNAGADFDLLRDKGRFWRRCHDVMGREYLDLRQASREAFGAFVARHPVWVAKAYNLAQGTGVEVVRDCRDPESAIQRYDTLKAGARFIIEELIVQHPDLNAIYDQAINSIRIYTLRTGEAVRQVNHPTIRFGSGGGQIDFEGGITVLLDGESGRSLSDGLTREGEFVVAHPDSRVRFCDVQVPKFSEAVALVQSAANRVPEFRYIGWDVAITPSGPIVIEANGAPSLEALQLLLARRHPQGLAGRQETMQLT